MAMRIRVVSGCFASGVAAMMLTGAAAQATTLTGTHASASVSAVGYGGTGGQSATTDGNPTQSSDATDSPSPAPSTPAPSTPAPATSSTLQPEVFASATTSPTASHTPSATTSPSTSPTASATPSPTASDTASTAPSGGANTGGGGSANGGSDLPLAAGGAATALVSAAVGLFAFRRWHSTRLPAG